MLVRDLAQREWTMSYTEVSFIIEWLRLCCYQVLVFLWPDQKMYKK